MGSTITTVTKWFAFVKEPRETYSKLLRQPGIKLLKILVIAFCLFWINNHLSRRPLSRELHSEEKVDLSLVEQMMPKEKRPEFKLEPKILHMIIQSHDDAAWRFGFDDRSECFAKFIKFWMHDKSIWWENNDWFNTTYTIAAYLPRFFRQHPEYKDKILEYIREGRIEIIGCGISEPDMATVYYDDLIGNYEYGREICKELNVDTRVGWDVDAFGSSSGVIRLLSEMGYDHMFLSRISNFVKERLKKEGKLTFNWKNQRYRDLNLMTQVYSAHYEVIPGLNESLNRIGDRILDPRIEGFLHMIRTTLAFTVSTDWPVFNLNQKNAILVVGGDFFFCDSGGYVERPRDPCPSVRIERIKLMVMVYNSNWKGGFYGNKILYSTFNSYLESVQKENRTYKEDDAKDFLPLRNYSGPDRELWVGFFTLHSGLKHSIRQYGLLSRGVMQYVANQVLEGEVSFDSASRLYRLLQESGYWQGFMTHHDAITGTTFIGPTLDYERQMQEGVEALTKYFKSAVSETKLPFDARILQNPEFTYVKGSFDSYYMVLNQNIQGQKLVRVVSPIRDLPFLKITRHDTGSIVELDKELITCDGSNCLITFKETFQRFEAKQYIIGSHSEPRNIAKFQQLQKLKSYTLKLNARVSLEVLVEEHTLKIVEHIQGVEKPVSLGFQVVDRTEHKNGGHHNSSFYVITCEAAFAPLEMAIYEATFRQTDTGATITAKYLTGEGTWIYFHFIYQSESDTLSRFSTRLNFQKYDQNHLMKSYNIRYIRDEIKSEGIFTSDTNGIESSQWTYDSEKYFPENVRPVTRFIGIHDEESKRGFWVLIDRPEGGLSPKAGVIELALVRYVEGIGGGGLPESVFEPALVIEHKLLPYSEKESVQDIRRLQIMEDAPLIVGEITRPEKAYRKRNEEVKSTVEESEYLRSLIAPKKDGIMLRLYNLHETEDIIIPDVARWAQKYYGFKNKVEISERSLDYNNPIEYVTKHQYGWKNSTLIEEAYSQTSIEGGKGVILKPLRTRTYRLIIKNE